MKTMAVFRALGPADLKNVRRDSLLVWIPVIPLVLALSLRLGVPAIESLLQARYAFDLAPYYSLIVSIYLLMAPTVVGMVVGFLLLDERDDHVLSALLVTPLPLGAYLLYRVSIPMALSIIVTLAGAPIVGLMPLSALSVVAAVLLGSFTCPLMALFLAAFAENKVAGFALVKLVNTVMLLPLAAHFLPEPWQYVVGMVPTYWPAKVYWLGAAGGGFGVELAAGIVVNLVALAALLRRVAVVLRR